MTMGLPESHAEFWQRFEESQALETCDLQTGLGMPCPFCAAPGFTTYPIFTHEAKKLPHPPLFCHECKRISKFFFETTTDIFGLVSMTFYVLQLSGPAQPAWFTPKIGWVQ